MTLLAGPTSDDRDAVAVVAVRLKRVCVYAGSSDGRDARYRDAAVELALALVADGIGVVYGGGKVGLMGALADAVLEAGGEIVGVIPQALVDHEVAHMGIDDLRVVASMHERKALMADLSDAFVALPGGIGTLEELIEVLTWTKLGLHAKPSALLNIGGYYDALIRFLDHAVDERFLMPGDRELLLVADRPDALIRALCGFTVPHGPKWLDREST